MRILLGSLLMLVLLSCDNGKEPITGATPFQLEKNAAFKDATTSPLKSKDRKRFTGLDFFAFDSSYVVTARLTRTPDSQWFNMKTTTNRLSKERIFGIITFTLQGEVHKLTIYQGEENMNTKGLEDYLFLPFLDATNGEDTYGGGRYMDLRIPKSDTVEIDFNKAYNPYCVYNEKFSCPIVPRGNYLPMEVKAGEKMFRSK